MTSRIISPSQRSDQGESSRGVGLRGDRLRVQDCRPHRQLGVVCRKFGTGCPRPANNTKPVVFVEHYWKSRMYECMAAAQYLPVSLHPIPRPVMLGNGVIFHRHPAKTGQIPLHKLPSYWESTTCHLYRVTLGHSRH